MSAKKNQAVVPSIAISSVHTLNVYLDANTKDTDRKFSRNLKNTSKKTCQWSLLKMTTFCLHTAPQTSLAQSSIDLSWPGEFLSSSSQSQPSASRGFSASGHRHVPLAPTTIYSSTDRDLG